MIAVVPVNETLCDATVPKSAVEADASVVTTPKPPVQPPDRFEHVSVGNLETFSVPLLILVAFVVSVVADAAKATPFVFVQVVLKVLAAHVQSPVPAFV